MTTVRTRVAPSPTGDPHVGTAYVALFNLCFARKHGGQFILRIEDTDQVRSTAQSEAKILEALRWLGLNWDEGPDVGGPHGPYRQSERSALYREHAERLVESGDAFWCYLTPEELTALRAENQASGGITRIQSPYADMDPAEARRKAAGKPGVVRLRVPGEGICTVNDGLRGTIEIPWDQVDQQVLLKTDGLPTYHLANVVDDHHMGITHVLRGEEWISSAPKHLLLYKALGWTPPALTHLPLLRNPDKSKLSKRKNPTSILYYQRMGYLPEAVLNYLGRMAWSMPDEAEKFTLEQMIENFDLNRISLGGPIFDVGKLEWLNGRYIREDLDDDAFADRVVQWALNRDHLKQVIPLVRPRVNKWTDLAPMASFFLDGLVALNPEDLRGIKGLDGDDAVREALTQVSWALDAEPEWTAATIEATLRTLCEQTGHKLRTLLAPVFVAISGRKSATPLFDTMAIVGRDLSRARLRAAVDALAPMSGKEEKKWKKAFDALRASAGTEGAEE